MKHRFQHICYDAVALLEDCNTLKEFMKRSVKQSELHPELWKPETYRGEAFEALVEVLINASPIDKRINIVDYQPWASYTIGTASNTTSGDYGVDGFGYSHNGNPHYVQAKFRGNTVQTLTANGDHISNFVAKASRHSNKHFKGQEIGMTIFTTAKDLHQAVNENMYEDDVTVLGYKELSKLIDENTSFWSIFKREMNV